MRNAECGMGIDYDYDYEHEHENSIGESIAIGDCLGGDSTYRMDG
jgi:hypothetical protein